MKISENGPNFYTLYNCLLIVYFLSHIVRIYSYMQLLLETYALKTIVDFLGC